ncbi:MAG: carbon-nitrogen hydrolase [Bacteroidales bacterium]|nr:carbon-nitrogen hydrolase [Bacteroidales bacterium]
MRKLKVALVQQSCSASIEENILKLEANIREAARKGAQLVVLQELHNSLYFCQEENAKLCDLAEPIPGPSTERFGALAKELGIVLVLSLFERRAPGIYHNTAVILEKDGTIAGKYRKMHIPDDPLFYEKFYFTPGDLGFVPVKTSVGTLGVLVCWDQWYPEAARLMALSGAEMLIYPTAIGGVPTDPDWEQAQQRQAWQLVQRGHAVANGLPVITANRTGVEPDPTGHSTGIDFWGHSFITGAQGELLTEFEKGEEGVHVVELDLEQCEYVRRGWPFLRDRRIDAYENLLKRYAK